LVLPQVFALLTYGVGGWTARACKAVVAGRELVTPNM